MDQIIPIGLLILLVSGYLFYYLRGRPRPSDISSLAELRARLVNTQYTIVQFYAPL